LVVVNDFDERLRAAAFAYLDQLRAVHGDFLSHVDLKAFTFQGKRVSLLQPMRGIRVVSGIDSALSITTAFKRPYEDEVGPDGYFRYKWRGEDGNAYDNRAMLSAMHEQRPLIYFEGVASGVYSASYPVWIVDSEPLDHRVVVALTDDLRWQWSTPDLLQHPADLAARQRYAERVVRQRLHQPRFSRQVLRAYAYSCTVCRLKRKELLEAAHIKDDSEGGLPIVTNGMAMCVIHHKAFDTNELGVRPDYIVEIRSDVMDDTDGPTLKYALQGVNGTKVVLPRQRASRPDQRLLEERFEQFRQAG
jgi:putative restriction endonuclease